MVFPSASRGDLKSCLNVGETTLTSKPEATTSSHVISVSRKPLQSDKGVVTPLSRGSANARKLMSFQAATNLGSSVKGSILIANNHRHQRNYVPPLEYYAKGTLLKIPECVKSRNPGNKKLTSKKLTPIDPVLSPDQVSGI